VNNRDVGIDPHVDAVLALRSATVDRRSGDSFGAVKGVPLTLQRAVPDQFRP
jgi:hypothetical protein